ARISLLEKSHSSSMFFFFSSRRRHTRLVSDWSSDVCSSDLKRKQWIEVWNSAYRKAKKDGKSDKEAESSAFAQANAVAGPKGKRSEERRVGKECRSRGWPCH